VRASAAVRPLRSVRAPPSSDQPPPRPAWEYTGIPAIASASRSRRAVRSEISSSSASPAAVTRPRAWRISRTATRRSARTVRGSHTNRPHGGHVDGARCPYTDECRLVIRSTQGTRYEEGCDDHLSDRGRGPHQDVREGPCA